MKQVNTRYTSQEVLGVTDQLALYDRYSPVAYGIILQIIPETELAQTVLIDLFSSSQLISRTEAPAVGEIVRLARAKALATKSLLSSPEPASIPLTEPNDTINTAKLVFTMSFFQGCSPGIIAEKLQLSSTNVLKAFYTYFKHLRSS